MIKVVWAQACLLCCTQAARVPCLVQLSASSACCCSAPEEAPLEIVQLVDRCLDRNPALRPDALKVIQTISASLYRSAQALTAIFVVEVATCLPHSMQQPGRPAWALQAKREYLACICTLLLPPWSCLASEKMPLHVWSRWEDLQQACWMHLSKCAATVSAPWLRPSKAEGPGRWPPPVLTPSKLLGAGLVHHVAPPARHSSRLSRMQRAHLSKCAATICLSSRLLCRAGGATWCTRPAPEQVCRNNLSQQPAAVPCRGCHMVHQADQRPLSDELHQLVDPEGGPQARVAAARHLVQLCARGGAAQVQAGLRSVWSAIAC